MFCMVFGVCVDFWQPYVDLMLMHNSFVLPHAPVTPSQVNSVVELCAGVAASSIGLSAAGFTHVCSVEWSEPLAQVHRSVHEHVPVVVGDISDEATLIAVKKHVPHNTSLVAGFSCQPFSVGGAQGGGSDPRAQSLTAVVRAAWLLQAPLLVLECVVPARDNVFVKQHLQVLQEQAGYCLSEEVYHLEHVWAAKRFRWWVVLSAPCFGQIALDPLPSPPSSLVIRDLLPYPRAWPQEQVDQLLLTNTEVRKMQMKGQTLRSYMVDPSQKLATALHSWGNQCQPCECGCRTTGLSDHLLATRGVFAQVMAVKTRDGLRYRHLTCEETALLCGMPPLVKWTSNARLNLCAVGQLASPLQSVWVGACIQRHIQGWLGNLDPVIPMQVLWSFKQDLMRQAAILYPVLPAVVPPRHTLVVTDLNGLTFEFAVTPPVLLRDFLMAETSLLGLTQDLVFINSQTGHLLDMDSSVVDLHLRIHCVSDLALAPCCSFDLEDSPTLLDDASMSSTTSFDVAMVAVCDRLDADPSGGLEEHTLMTLKAAQLQALLPPLVTTHAVLTQMSNQHLSASDRLQLLRTQELLWADDEIRFGVLSVLALATDACPCFLDPLLAFGWMNSHVDPQPQVQLWLQSHHMPTCLVSVMYVSGHWIPVHWKATSLDLKVSLWDYADIDTDVLWPFHQILCRALGCATFSVFCTQRSFGEHHCGAAAVAYVAHRTLGHDLPISVAELDLLHNQFRQAFASHVSEKYTVSRPWCFALGPAEILPTLCALLQYHGVPAGQTATRARLVQQSLGKEEVTKALHGTSPWKSLKALANLHVPPLQLVLPDEQAAKTQPSSKPKAKKTKSSSRSQVPLTLRPAELDPAKLTVDPGVFRTSQDRPLSSLPLTQVGPLASGVALTTYIDAQPFLKAGNVLATGGLALIVIDGPDEPDTQLQWSTVRFAARCSLNQEPLLLTGILIQLGKDLVELHSPQGGVPVPAVEVACARVTVFKDQWPDQWELFVQSPVKLVFEFIPKLQTCRTANCQCPKWHLTNTPGEHESVLDVFRRQFFTEAGRPTSGEKAAFFGFMIRYVKDVETQVLMCSGKHGVYIEPKTEDATRPSTDFQVVWLPAGDFAAAQHKSQCEPHSMGLARHNQRYGIRVAAPHYQAVFQSMRPDAIFLAPGPRSLWSCGPFPFGVDRKCLGRILKNWQWDARPMQPSRTVQGGLMWTIQAVTEPPATVFSLPHGQVVISRQDQPDTQANQLPRQIIGQSKTVQLCATKQPGAPDPWLANDPWKPKVATANPPLQSTDSDALQELEKRLEASLIAKLPQAVTDMEVDTQDDRVTKLEQQVQVLMQQHQDLEVRVNDNHTQATAQVHSLQGQMQAQFEAQGKQMQSMMDDQLTRLESILSRRSTPRAGPYEANREWKSGSAGSRPKPSVCRWILPRVFFHLFVVLSCLRVGEAKVPGPSDSPVLHISVANPSGIQGKYQLLSDIQSDILLLSETHHTASAEDALLRSWRATRSTYRTVVSGCPMTPRSTASDAGQWAGVLFAAAHPMRSLSVPWPPDLYATGRVQFASAFCHNMWISCGLVYGYPEGSKCHSNQLDRTNAILDFAVDCLLDMSGPRILGGDWNFEPHQLSACDRLAAYGWKEVQDLEFLRSGRPVSFTCKNSTRKDFLYVSPELACHFKALIVDNLSFADHAVLHASFTCSGSAPVRYLWPCPSAVPWASCHLSSSFVDFSSQDPTEAYRSLWQSAETQAQSQLGDNWHKSMGGRARQTAPSVRRGWPVPLRKGRTHEVQPAFFGFSVQHAKWFRQLRRLQAFCAWSKAHEQGTPTLQHSIHGLDLWKSILNSTGFQPTFAAWWLGRSYHGPFDPVHIPSWPPSFAVSCCIYDAVLCEIRLLEARLNAARKAKRTHERDLNPNLVFRDVRRPLAAPVESLLQSTEVEITDVVVDELKLSLARPCTFDREQPIFAAGAKLDVIMHDSDALWVGELPALQPGDKVIQSTPLGELDLIFEAFHLQWKARWGRHDTIPHSRWEQLVGFAKQVLPFHPVAHVPLTPALLRAEVKRKKATSATGLDGISRMDLLQAPDALLHDLLGLYRRAETDGTWPGQILAGKVTSLAKCADAQTTNQYRPITVFGFPYRVWTSIHARRLLDAANLWAHDGIQGNRKGRQTAHLWKCLALGLEEAAESSHHLHGLTADIEKCYNCLPRWPIFAMSALCGSPVEVNVAWAGAVTDMVRHFRVRDSLSQGISSSTGLAEGCALSCYGMLLLDHVFHRYVEVQGGGGILRAHTFVDNWELTTVDPDWAVRQLDIVLDFAALADLTVDRKKTLAWSTSAGVRAQFRARGLTVADNARDLGAHMGYTKRYSNVTLTSRLQALDEFWPKLRATPAPWRLKLRLLRTVAWPRGLYAASSAPVGQTVWNTLRQKVVKALAFQKPGVNPHVLVGLAEPSIDPEFVATLSTIQDARAFCPVAWWSDFVFRCAEGLSACAPTSPAMVLVSRIQPLGIQVLPSGLWADQFGSFDPSSCHFTELVLRLGWCWQHVVANHVAHRADFGGLGSVDVVASRRNAVGLSVSQQALLRLGRCGGSFTEDYRSHWTQSDDCCKWCGEPDSLEHRYWRCPQTQPFRDLCAPFTKTCWTTLAPAVTLRGWALRASTWFEWTSALLALPTVVPPSWAVLRTGAWNDVFTDGSCFDQACPDIRIAAWGAVLASPFVPGWLTCPAQPLGSGPLPGLCQTAFRAELYAFAVVLHWASFMRSPVWVWMDCLGVINKFSHLTSGHAKLNPSAANADLWQWILHSVESLGLDNVQLFKVKAHQKTKADTDPLTEWKNWHNSAADRTAVAANENRPAQFRQLRERHLRALQDAALISREVQALHVAVAEFSSQQSVEDPADLEHREPKQTRQFDCHYDAAAWTGQVPTDLAAQYGWGHAERAVRWWSRRTADSDQPLRWISFVQLYIDFQLTFGCPGPIKHKTQWLDVSTRPFLDVNKYPFRDRMRWFRRFIQNMLKAAHVEARFEQCRPESDCLQAFLPSMAVCWDPMCLQQVETWLQQHLREPCRRAAGALVSLPCPTRATGMAIGDWSGDHWSAGKSRVRSWTWATLMTENMENMVF